MLIDPSSDAGIQSFERDVRRRPRAARRKLSEWAGMVWYADRYAERFGFPATESPETALTRERLMAVVRARLPHLDSDAGNGRSCECRYLQIALGAFDRDRLTATRRRYATVSNVTVNGLFAAAVLVTGFWYLDDASAMKSDRAFDFLAGISGGLVVATIQMVIAITTSLTDRVAETVEWRWFHPDSDWRLLGAVDPRHRRRMRHAHLRRAADVVLRPVAAGPAGRPPGRRLAARLARAYQAFTQESPTESCGGERPGAPRRPRLEAARQRGRQET